MVALYTSRLMTRHDVGMKMLGRLYKGIQKHRTLKAVNLSYLIKTLQRFVNRQITITKCLRRKDRDEGWKKKF